jgi:PPOX class probable F420-dependent enzyme
MDKLELFQSQQYMNLETFRKSGEGVKTPVWFVQYNGELCFTTEPQSGKVKRIRRNPAVRVAPCTMDGTVTGTWFPATSRFMTPEEIKQVDKVYNKKYGVMKFLFSLPSLFRKKPERVFIALTLEK